MSNFQASCSKTLVRNTKQRVPKTNVSKEPGVKPEEKKKILKHEQPKKQIDLGLPTINTSKTVIKKIKQVESLKQCKSKSVSDIDVESRMTIQEKITKQMNFPYDQQIFKDLIPLCVKSTVPQVPSSRQPLPQKDIEPDLRDFVKHKTLPEYSFQVRTTNKSQKSIREYDGFKLHKLVQRW